MHKPENLPETLSASVARIILSCRTVKRNVPVDVNLAISHIENMIDRGIFKPGDKLVENDISANIGVGRGRVREAIRILSGEGVVELIANRGGRVRALTSDQLIWGVDAGAALTQRGLELFLEKRTSDPLLARKELDFVNKRIQNIRKTERTADAINWMTDYRLIVNAFSGNPYLNRVVSSFHSRFHGKFLSSYVQPEDIDRCIDIQTALHSALSDNDAACLEYSRKFLDVILHRLEASRTRA